MPEGIALAESVRRYSTIFERYFELPSSVIDIISKSIKSRADQIDSLASGPMAEEKPNHEMVLKHFSARFAAFGGNYHQSSSRRIFDRPRTACDG